eukprot:gene21789-biopygen17677
MPAPRPHHPSQKMPIARATPAPVSCDPWAKPSPLGGAPSSGRCPLLWAGPPPLGGPPSSG